MKIKGEYRDVLGRNGVLIVNTGWKSNAIAAVYGRFLAALMKKDFKGEVGIDYMAVGSGSDNDLAVFKGKVVKFFDEWHNKGNSGQLKGDDYWVWAKKVEGGDITYLNHEDKVVNTVTNRLKIDVKFEKDEKLDTAKQFFINYVDHEQITKDKSMEHTRTILLTLPIEEKEVVS